MDDDEHLTVVPERPIWLTLTMCRRDNKKESLSEQLFIRFPFLLVELEMDTENVVEMEGQQTILKNPISMDKMDR